LGKRGGTEISSDDRLPYTQNSPYLALCLAMFMGARRIGLIGVDFTNDHFFGKTGRHALTRHLAQIDREYKRLQQSASRQGIEIFNLSSESRLTAFPKVSLRQFETGVPESAAIPSRVTPTPAKPTREKVQAPNAAKKEPAMRIAIQRYRPGLVNDLLDALADTCRDLGHSVTRSVDRFDRQRKVVNFVWNGRAHHCAGPTFYCEHGWLPRWDYQISQAGINADHDDAPFVWNGERLTDEEVLQVEAHIERIKKGAPRSTEYIQTTAPVSSDLPEDFLLVPLQMERDTNILRHAPARLRSMQRLIDHVSAANPPYPVIFKQHPADARRRSQQLRLRLRRRQDLLRPHDAGNIHQLLRGGGCRGIITINSNVVHDGMIWDVPGIVLGKNVWPTDGKSPFLHSLPADWTRLELQRCDKEWIARRQAYACFLMSTQWSLADARNPDKIRTLLKQAHNKLPRSYVRATPLPRRARMTRTARRTGRTLVNVTCRNHGWLFEDLKRAFQKRQHPGAAIVVSNKPITDADVWLVIRAHEIADVPDPSRTLVQVHDMFEDDLYRPGGRRALVGRCPSIALTNPGQRDILERAGIQLHAKSVIDRPIGAAEQFRLRSALAKEFTVGWVGRPVMRDGRDIKRTDEIIEVLSRFGKDVRVVVIGERVDKQLKLLQAAGVACDFYPRSRYPHRAYPQLYQKLDCVVNYSEMAAGPHSLFEALATGVPVVSSPVGWAPKLLANGNNGYIVDTTDDMLARLYDIREDRQGWFGKREEIRSSLDAYTLESWLDENLACAAQIALRVAA
jgi:glycosyltransferase involved in cell wall biosynthesis